MYIYYYMMTYIPSNLNQCFILLIFQDNTYMLLESGLSKLMPMYTGKNRNYVEQMLKTIKNTAIKYNLKKTSLNVFDVNEETGLKLKLQSPFYNIIKIT